MGPTLFWSFETGTSAGFASQAFLDGEKKKTKLYGSQV